MKGTIIGVAIVAIVAVVAMGVVLAIVAAVVSNARGGREAPRLEPGSPPADRTVGGDPLAQGARALRQQILAEPDADRQRDLLVPLVGVPLGRYPNSDLDTSGPGKIRLRAPVGERTLELDLRGSGRIARLALVGPWGEPLDDARCRALLAGVGAAELGGLVVSGDALVLEPRQHLLDPTVADPEAHLGALLNALERVGRQVPLEPEPETEPETEPADPHVARIREAEYGDAAARSQALAPLLDDLATVVDRPKIVLPREHPDGEAELRGRVDDIPVRLIIGSGGHVRVEARAGTANFATLHHDPDKVPLTPDAEDDWADRDLLRVFVGKALYVEGDQDAIDDALALFESLSADDVAHIERGFVDLELDHLTIGPSLSAGLPSNIYRHEGLRERLTGLLRFIGGLGSRVGRTETSPLTQNRCVYCGSRYFFGITRPACPNCGAPPGA